LARQVKDLQVATAQEAEAQVEVAVVVVQAVLAQQEALVLAVRVLRQASQVHR